MAKDAPDRATVVTFVAKLIKSDPEISYGDMKKKCRDAGLHIYPLIVGLARKELGMAPSAKAKSAPKPAGKRGPGRPRKDAAAAAPTAAPAKRGPGRPPKARTMLATGDAAGALAALEREFSAMREALRAIADVASRF